MYCRIPDGICQNTDTKQSVLVLVLYVSCLLQFDIRNSPLHHSNRVYCFPGKKKTYGVAGKGTEARIRRHDARSGSCVVTEPLTFKQYIDIITAAFGGTRCLFYSGLFHQKIRQFCNLTSIMQLTTGGTEKCATVSPDYS